MTTPNKRGKKKVKCSKTAHQFDCDCPVHPTYAVMRIEYGHPTKVAVIRLGLCTDIKFVVLKQTRPIPKRRSEK